MCSSDLVASSPFGYFDNDLGEWIDIDIPEGLPRGETCDPSEPLPSASTSVVTTTSALLSTGSDEASSSSSASFAALSFVAGICTVIAASM